jgi:hypothetical protein
MAKSSLDKMKERLKKSSPKISGRANLENMNQIKNFMFGKKKAMGVDDDVLGITTQKAKKKIKAKKPSSGGGQGQSKGNVYLRTGKNTSMTLLGGSARKITPYKFDKDGVKPIKKDGTKKTTSNNTKKTTSNKNDKITQGSTMTKIKNPSIVTKEQLKKSGLSLRDYMNFMQGKTRRDDKKTKKTTTPTKVTLKASQMPKRKPVMVDDFAKSKVKQSSTKTTSTKDKKSFMDRVKADIDKAIKETKRNFQGDIKKGTGRYKSVNERNLDAKGNYKGTNIKPTELQLSRMKKKKMMGGGYAMKKKKMMGGGYSTKKKK